MMPRVSMFSGHLILLYTVLGTSLLWSGVSYAGNPSPTPSPTQTWSLLQDFRVSPNEANPNPDSYGNPDVWYFMDGFSVSSPASSSLLPDFVVGAFGDPGVQAWTVGDSIPEVGFYPVTFPGVNLTGINIHPSAGG
jgi:hypothetical protein